MKTAKIKIKGQTIPVRMTMGALLAYKEKTGQDVSEMNQKDTTAMLELLLCCIESVCRADGIQIEGVDMAHLADYIEVADMAALSQALLSPEEGNAKRPAKE